MVQIFGNPYSILIFLTIIRISFQLILLRIPFLKILMNKHYLFVPPHKFQPINALGLELSVKEHLTKYILLSFITSFHLWSWAELNRRPVYLPSQVIHNLVSSKSVVTNNPPCPILLRMV